MKSPLWYYVPWPQWVNPELTYAVGLSLLVVGGEFTYLVIAFDAAERIKRYTRAGVMKCTNIHTGWLLQRDGGNGRLTAQWNSWSSGVNGIGSVELMCGARVTELVVYRLVRNFTCMIHNLLQIRGRKSACFGLWYIAKEYFKMTDFGHNS